MIAAAIMPGWGGKNMKHNTPPTRTADAVRPPRVGGGENIRARVLRKTATDAERILWSALRDFKRTGLHFRRQAPIGTYVVDFACHRSKIVVELDGSQHSEDQAVVHDTKRTAFLNSRGYRVLRFWNVDVIKNLQGVCDAILAAAKNGPPTRRALRAPTSPRRGR